MVQIKLLLLISFILIGQAEVAFGKIYKRCELARELKNVHKASQNQTATWVCIAARESNYNTKLVSRPNKHGSRDHGIFQINDKYWCSPPGTGKGCGQPCSKFRDEDISDDYKCIQTIFNETKRLTGDGFYAWTAYRRHCKGTKADKYIKGCF